MCFGCKKMLRTERQAAPLIANVPFLARAHAAHA